MSPLVLSFQRREVNLITLLFVGLKHNGGDPEESEEEEEEEEKEEEDNYYNDDDDEEEEEDDDEIAVAYSELRSLIYRQESEQEDLFQLSEFEVNLTPFRIHSTRRYLLH